MRRRPAPADHARPRRACAGSDAVEVDARILLDQRGGWARGIRVQRGPSSRPRVAVGEIVVPSGVAQLPTPWPAEARTARSAPGRARSAGRVNERADRERLRAGGCRADPCRRDQNQATDELRSPHRQPETDEAAERMPHQDRWRAALALEQQRHAVGERLEVRQRGQGRRPPWPGRSGTITR